MVSWIGSEQKCLAWFEFWVKALFVIWGAPGPTQGIVWRSEVWIKWAIKGPNWPRVKKHCQVDTNCHKLMNKSAMDVPDGCFRMRVACRRKITSNAPRPHSHQRVLQDERLWDKLCIWCDISCLYMSEKSESNSSKHAPFTLFLYNFSNTTSRYKPHQAAIHCYAWFVLTCHGWTCCTTRESQDLCCYALQGAGKLCVLRGVSPRGDHGHVVVARAKAGGEHLGIASSSHQ